MTEYWSILEAPIVLIPGSALAGLANNSSVLGASVSNLQGAGTGTGDGATLGRLTLTYQFGSAPTANTAIAVWLCKNVDGTTGASFEDGSASVTPTRCPDAVFSVGPSTDTNVHVIAKDIIVPAGWIKALVQNAGTGQAFGSTSGNLGLTLTPITYQGV
jgi:hypothetical protein